MTPVHAVAGKNTKGVAVRPRGKEVPGFRASAVSVPIKKGHTRPDLGLIFSEVPAVTAGVFTRNLVKAAPVQIDLERIGHQKSRAILVNSGNANACTGPGGLTDTRKLSSMISRALSIPDQEIFLASTGVIGQRLPLNRMLKAVPSLVQSLSPQGLASVAEAIMTTDTFPKFLREEIVLGRKKIRIAAMAKGSGMIRPDMATMLCFVLTDAVISPALLDRFLRKATDQSFNRITVDGDTSTNDLVLAMANGLAGNKELADPRTKGAKTFSRVLDDLLYRLARMLIQDGEGATKDVTIRIEGTANEEEARTLAFTVAHSPLVKTALFGQDANWGRILAAMGRAGVSFNPEKVDIYFDRIQIVKNGISKGLKEEARAAGVLKKPSLTIRVDLHQGPAHFQIHTCDLSLDYVRINADYRT